MFYWYMTSDACNYEKWLIVVFKFKKKKKKVNNFFLNNNNKINK